MSAAAVGEPASAAAVGKPASAAAEITPVEAAGCCWAGRDRGAATILVLAFGLFLTVAGVAAAGVGTARVGRHQARAAADLGALAGAAKAVYGSEVACARAGQLVAANHGRMVSCVVDGLDIVVRAEVAVPGLGRRAVATARAGPVYVLPAVASFVERAASPTRSSTARQPITSSRD